MIRTGAKMVGNVRAGALRTGAGLHRTVRRSDRAGVLRELNGRKLHPADPNRREYQEEITYA